MNNLPQILEAILFVSGDAVERIDILDKLNILEEELEDALQTLKEKYDEKSGIEIITFRNKIQLCSNSNYAEEVASVLNPIRERKLSKAMLEAMAIVAYKQPITRLEVENIRGVNSDYALQNLLKHNLIEVVGRKEALGKPMLFGTTDEFLKRFNLSDINSLPDYDDLMEAITKINQERNTLYNEFDIPDEEEELADNNNTQKVVQLEEEAFENAISQEEIKLKEETI